ncbi:MAG TPA: SMP-30/gluconolactonase/LRE family protein [Methylophilaceae bacterium]|nr:SMP-30/gluconolactonase/LRE family protein [Methylophilaceae bacterium]
MSLNKKHIVTLCLGGLLVSIGLSVQAHQGKTVTGLKTPESVVEAPDGRVFVSEIGEFGKDGDGEISYIDKDGKRHPFASGMDDPKGLALIGDDLYVADKTRVLKVGSDGKWQVFAAATAFPTTPKFLNDLEADPHGMLYVSDSGNLEGVGGAIYSIDRDGKVTLLIDGAKDKRVLAPNGLLADDTGKALLEVDFVSGILYKLDLATGEMQELASGFGGGDGLVHHPKGLMFVSDWKNGKVFSVDAVKDEVKLLKAGFKASADIAMSRDGRYVIVPDMKAGEVVWLPIHIK